VDGVTPWLLPALVPVKRRLAEFIRLLLLVLPAGTYSTRHSLSLTAHSESSLRSIHLTRIFWLSIVCEANFESIYIYLFFRFGLETLYLSDMATWHKHQVLSVSCSSGHSVIPPCLSSTQASSCRVHSITPPLFCLRGRIRLTGTLSLTGRSDSSLRYTPTSPYLLVIYRLRS
jgi:hypothetical protein